MKQAKYSQVIAFFGLLLVISILHHEHVTHYCNRHLTIFSNARDGLLESAKYQFIDEIEFLDKDQSLKRILVFSNQASDYDAVNVERVVITDANYEVCSRIEISGTTRIQNIAAMQLNTLPILEIVRYQAGRNYSVICTHYFIQDGNLIPDPQTGNRV